MLEVTCAVILDGTKILAVQRGPESSHPWKWEFPGGKINPEETGAECVVREVEEELGLQIEVLSQMEYIDYEYDIERIRLIPFVCNISSGEISLNEHVAKRWFCFVEWELIDWQEADRELILKNRARLKKMTM